jgi:hypothetical protein
VSNQARATDSDIHFINVQVLVPQGLLIEGCIARHCYETSAILYWDSVTEKFISVRNGCVTSDILII